MKWTSIGTKLRERFRYKYRLNILYILIPIGLIMLTSWLYENQSRQESANTVIQNISEEIERIDSAVALYPNIIDTTFSNANINVPYIHILSNDSYALFWNFNLIDLNKLREILSPGKYFLSYKDTTYYFHVFQKEGYNIFLGTPLFNEKKQLLCFRDLEIIATSQISYRLNILKEVVPFKSHNLYDYIIINDNNPIQIVPNVWVQITFYLFVVSLLIVVYFLVQDLMKVINPLYIWVPFAILITILLYSSHAYIGIPYNLKNTHLFDPDIFSSVDYWNSLPVVILHILILGLLFLLYSLNIRSVHYSNIESIPLRISIILIVLFIHVFFFSIYLVPLLHTLIIDSQVSFSFYNFNKVSILSFVILHFCIFIINILTSIIYSVKKLTKSLSSSIIIRIMVLILCLLIAYLIPLSQHSWFEVIITAILFVSYYLVSYLLPFPISSKPDAFQNIFTFKGLIWYLLTAVMLSTFIYYFNNEKENRYREQFASSLIITNDINAEYQHHELITNIEGDIRKGYIDEEDIISIIKSKSDSIFSYFDLQKVFIYDDSIVKNDFNLMDWKFSEMDNQIDYYSKITLSERQYELLTPIHIDNTLKYIYTRFFIPFNVANALAKQYDNDNLFVKYYSVGIYYNGQIMSKNGSSMSKFSQVDNYENERGFKNRLFYSTFIYPSDYGQKVVVLYEKNSIFHFLSKVSYSLLFLLLNTYLFVQIAKFFRTKSREKSINKNSFRLNINYGIVASVFLSSILIAIISIVYYRNVNIQNNIESIEKERSLFENKMNFVIKNTLDSNDSLFNMSREHLNRFLREISAAESYKVTIFNTKGVRLNNQGQRFNMPPIAYKAYLLSNLKTYDSQSGIYQFYNESHTVYYILNVQDKNIGVIKFQPSDILDTSNTRINTIISVLVNVYIFLLIFSIIVSIIVSQKLTSNLRILSNQFSKLQLSHNNILHYDRNDELQPIVDEYNKMIFKLEKMAKDLAIKNREDAWKDVAKQVAHEINNPITPIKLNIQYLIKAAEQGKDIQQLFINVSPSILEQIDKLNNIAATFSSLAKMPDPKMQNINIVKLIQNIVKLMDIDNKSTLHFNTTHESVWINADADFINIIFINLIKNASHAIKDKTDGVINVNINKEATEILITVMDNGYGMNEDTQSKLFTPNFTTKSSGSGIGLFMSKNLIQGMQGSIEFHSEINIGTTFYVRFPLISQ